MNIFKFCLDKTGKEKQIIKTMEELAELIQECSKLLLNDKLNHNMISEIADTELMIEQLKEICYTYDDKEYINHEIEKIKKEKIRKVLKSFS